MTEHKHPAESMPSDSAVNSEEPSGKIKIGHTKKAVLALVTARPSVKLHDESFHEPKAFSFMVTESLLAKLELLASVGDQHAAALSGDFVHFKALGTDWSKDPLATVAESTLTLTLQDAHSFGVVNSVAVPLKQLRSAFMEAVTSNKDAIFICSSDSNETGEKWVSFKETLRIAEHNVRYFSRDLSALTELSSLCDGWLLAEAPIEISI